jgi:hypothetical protein
MKNVTHNKQAETRKYAVVLLERGVSYSEIERETGIPVSTLRVMKNRLKPSKNDALQTVTPIVTDDVTQDESVTNVTDNSVTVTVKRYKIPFHIIALEAGYYVTVATACYGFSLAMPGVIGYSFAVVYGLLSFAALQMVKDSSIPKSAEYGRNMVYVLEVVACVFAHYYTINRALWANLKSLPFEVKYLPKGGTWELDYTGKTINGYWHNGEVVFNLACILSVILAGLAVAAISLRLELTKEKTRYDNEKANYPSGG